MGVRVEEFGAQVRTVCHHERGGLQLRSRAGGLTPSYENLGGRMILLDEQRRHKEKMASAKPMVEEISSPQLFFLRKKRTHIPVEGVSLVRVCVCVCCVVLDGATSMAG